MALIFAPLYIFTQIVFLTDGTSYVYLLNKRANAFYQYLWGRLIKYSFTLIYSFFWRVFWRVSEPLGRKVMILGKVMTNLDSILKSRDITLPTKVHLVKAMVFPIVMYGCKNWTIKKAKHQRIGAFKLWCWRRLLRVPWTARRSNQSILKEISPKYSLDAEAEVPILWPPDAKS